MNSNERSRMLEAGFVLMLPGLALALLHIDITVLAVATGLLALARWWPRF